MNSSRLRDGLALVYRRLPSRAQAWLAPRVPGLESPWGDDDNHPERLLVLPYVVGCCLEVGCGHRKTAPSVLGLDRTPRGEVGSVGNVAGHPSEADIVGDGASLPFADESFDSLIARHNLEHYVDTAAVLAEWRRVMKSGATIAVVLPDEENYPGRTLDLDPTHFHGYSRDALGKLVQLVGGFSDIKTCTAYDRWSFLLTAVKD